MICFGFIYETFVEIFRQMFETMQMGAFGSTSSELTKKFTEITNLSTVFLNTIGIAFYLILAIYLLLIWFQTIGRGLEMLILRFGIPFACIGLLNPDGGAFKGYFQKIIKIGFTAIVQLLLVRLSIVLTCGGHIVIALATAMMGYKTPGILNEFMATSGGGYYGASGAGRILSHGTIITRGLKKGA